MDHARERKRSDAVAAHLAAVVESSVDAIVSSTLDGTIVTWNPGAERLYGYAEAEVRGKSISLLAPDGQPDELPWLLDLLANSSQLDPFETMQQRNDGSLVDVLVTMSPVRDLHGRIIGASTIARDVGEQTRAVRELAQARADIDRFFDLALDLMAIANSDGYFVRVNRAFEDVLGYETDELLAHPLMDFVHPDDVQRTIDAHAAQAAGSPVAGFENRLRCKDSSYRWLRWSSAVEGGVTYSIARDVTESKAMEEELRASREKALEASRLKSEFVANMSHEIRTPLNGVVCMSELLLDTELRGDQREYAEVALTSAEALMRVINDILDFSKIEAGKLDVVCEDFSIEATVSEVCEIVGAKAHEKQLELAVSIDADVPPAVRGDANRLRQVLMNLLGNAVKFTSEGEIVVRVGVARLVRGTERLRVEVADTGIGIEPDNVTALFQPFSQADATTTRRYGGSGLGLCIAKQLVELMGGEIGLESVPGEGSTFWFTLPCERGIGVEAELSVKDLTGTRLLIVDDNATNRVILEQQAAHWGMAPDSADSGDSALELLVRAADAGRPYEVAVIDMHMPGMDGLELARAIKGNPRLRSTRLIMLSSSPIRTSETRNAGIEVQLTKPVRQSRLYNQLVASLERATRTAQRRPRPGFASSAPSSSRHVLVAEDNEVNQFAASQVLRRLGYDVDVAANGREAVRMTSQKDYAAVFMDCQMPEIDGYTAAATIRRREGNGRHTPIIAMTAHTMEGDREKCLAAGMDDYIAKPMRLRDVATVCDRLVDVDAPDGAASRPSAPVFDPTSLAEIADGAVERQLIGMFLDQLSARVPTLADAIAAQAAGKMHDIAHQLKGSAATIGAPAVMEICDGICKIGKTGGVAGAAELHARLADVAAQTSDAMRAYLEQTAA